MKGTYTFGIVPESSFGSVQHQYFSQSLTNTPLISIKTPDVLTFRPLKQLVSVMSTMNLKDHCTIFLETHYDLDSIFLLALNSELQYIICVYSKLYLQRKSKRLEYLSVKTVFCLIQNTYICRQEPFSQYIPNASMQLDRYSFYTCNRATHIYSFPSSIFSFPSSSSPFCFSSLTFH